MIEIINKGVLLSDKVRVYKDIFHKTRGLMFSRPLKKGEAIILEADEESILETTIHMLFVFFTIDVIWLNKNREVVEIKENVRAFTPLIVPRKPAKYVLELPKKTARHVNIGDKLEFHKR